MNEVEQKQENNVEEKEKLQDINFPPEVLSKLHPMVGQIIALCGGSLTASIFTLYHMIVSIMWERDCMEFSFTEDAMKNASDRKVMLYVEDGILKAKIMDKKNKIITLDKKLLRP